MVYLHGIVFGLAILTEFNQDPSVSDLELIQGTWVVTSNTTNGSVVPDFLESRITYSGTEVISQPKNCPPRLPNTETRCRFLLDATTTPRTIFWILENGDHLPGAYSLAGDYLVICVEKDYEQRPATLSSEIGDNRVLFTLRRVTINSLDKGEAKDAEDCGMTRSTNRKHCTSSSLSRCSRRVVMRRARCIRLRCRKK